MPRVPLKKCKTKLIMQSACHSARYLVNYAQSYWSDSKIKELHIIGLKSKLFFYRG